MPPWASFLLWLFALPVLPVSGRPRWPCVRSVIAPLQLSVSAAHLRVRVRPSETAYGEKLAKASLPWPRRPAGEWPRRPAKEVLLARTGPASDARLFAGEEPNESSSASSIRASDPRVFISVRGLAGGGAGLAGGGAIVGTNAGAAATGAGAGGGTIGTTSSIESIICATGVGG